jgi:hypothetical protein
MLLKLFRLTAFSEMKSPDFSLMTTTRIFHHYMSNLIRGSTPFLFNRWGNIVEK